LVAQNIFYPFLNLALIFEKRKINLLKKKKEWAGAADASQAGPDPRPAGPGAAKSVRRHPIQIGRRADLLPRGIAHAGEASRES
jgi:hypothetical protein